MKILLLFALCVLLVPLTESADIITCMICEAHCQNDSICIANNCQAACSSLAHQRADQSADRLANTRKRMLFGL